MAKNRAEIEAVAEPGREDPGIEIGIAHDVDTAERGVVGIMSRLKAAGLIGHSERNRAVVRDFPALAARTPAAQSLVEISGGDRIETSLSAAI